MYGKNLLLIKQKSKDQHGFRYLIVGEQIAWRQKNVEEGAGNCLTTQPEKELRSLLVLFPPSGCQIVCSTRMSLVAPSSSPIWAHLSPEYPTLSEGRVESRMVTAALLEC